MKTIIVPTDFSPIADNAMRFAADMAANINAPLMLVHVYYIPVGLGELPVAFSSGDEMKKFSEEKLAERKSAIEKIHGNKIKIYSEARMGTVVDQISELCNSIHPFAVVMGTRGAGKLERTLFGSSTLTAIKHLQVPVMIIPPDASFKPVKKIGLACDFKDVVTTTPEKEIHNVLKAFNAELHILNVDYKNQHFKPETPEQSFLLHNMLVDMNPVYHWLEKENIEEGLNEFATKNNIDILIIIPKKHHLLEGLFHKSQSKEMVFHAQVPVMSIHE
jgi:nucleotide-binding universal stress UspA family protein